MSTNKTNGNQCTYSSKECYMKITRVQYKCWCDQGCDSYFAGGVESSQNLKEKSVEGIEEKQCKSAEV